MHFCFFPLHSEMSIAISPNFGKCIDMRDNTSGSSIQPLGSEQAYEPYKAGGLGAEVPLVNCAGSKSYKHNVWACAY